MGLCVGDRVGSCVGAGVLVGKEVKVGREDDEGGNVGSRVSDGAAVGAGVKLPMLGTTAQDGQAMAKKIK